MLKTKNEHQHLIMIAWNDLIGISRVRGVPSSRKDSVLKNGLGWACAGHALLPNGDIADNPWGPLDEVTQLPDPKTEIFLEARGEHTAYHLLIADALDKEGQAWDCCPRSLCKAALEAFKQKTGLSLITAFEHEFSLITDADMGSAFTLDSTRLGANFLQSLVNNVDAIGGGIETYESEYGSNQYEISCGPLSGIAGPDRALLVREIIRETARRADCKASFIPKPDAHSPGNGMHLHFSFCDNKGRPASFDANGPGQLNELAVQFVAGINHHMAALMAFAAPTPLSYERIGPGHWSCGYACVGVQNREAALRIIPDTKNTNGSSHNIEFRPPDSTTNPYLLLAALIYAGLDGIEQQMPMPALLTVDPHELEDSKKQSLGVEPLPSSLSQALVALKKNSVLSQKLPDKLLRTFLAIKQAEIDHADNIGLEGAYKLYGDVY